MFLITKDARRLAKAAKGDAMRRFEASECYAATPAQAFALFRRPEERVRLSPPELHLQLVEGPAELRLGSRLTVKGRRWGVTQWMVSEITAFEDGALIVEEQRQGPFRSWKHTQRFAPTAEGGVCITDVIEYEPPGGVLGRLATAEAIQRELERAFAHRRERLTEVLGEAPSEPEA
jgi:ligand-binding SRPBCC domain-containing protein